MTFLSFRIDLCLRESCEFTVQIHGQISRLRLGLRIDGTNTLRQRSSAIIAPRLGEPETNNTFARHFHNQQCFTACWLEAAVVPFRPLAPILEMLVPMFEIVYADTWCQKNKLCWNYRIGTYFLMHGTYLVVFFLNRFTLALRSLPFQNSVWEFLQNLFIQFRQRLLLKFL